MSTNWDSFVKRRKIKVSSFLELNKIKSKVEFLTYLTQIGIEPPSDDTINEIFPSPPPVIEEVEIQVPPEPTFPKNVLTVVKPTPEEKQAKQKSNVNNNTKK